MPSHRNTLIAAVLALGLAAPTAFAQETGVDTVVASVGGNDITIGHMIVMAAQLPQEYQSLPDEVLYKAVLDQLVKQTAIAATVEDRLSRESRLALENQRRAFLAGEALNLVAKDAVTEEAVQAVYEKKYANAAPEREYNAAHILVETREEAQAIKDEVEAGADFAEVAKQKSTGPSGPSGGALGWFGPGMMVQPFEEAVMALQDGQISDPVETQFGWHIVKLNESRDRAAPTLEEVRSEIVSMLQEEAVTEAIEEMVADAEITRTEEEIDPAILRNMEMLQD